MKLSDLLAKTRVVAVEYEGETINLVVRAEAITPNLMATLLSFSKTNLDAEDMTRMADIVPALVCQVVESWDLLGEDDEPFPLDPAQVAASIPMAFLAAVLQGATATMGEAPAAKSGKTSGATSLRAVK